MGWSFVILIAVSAAAGIALGRVISRRARHFILLGGVEAGLLVGGLTWARAAGVELPLDSGAAHFLTVGALAIAAVLVPFGVGATWSGP